MTVGMTLLCIWSNLQALFPNSSGLILSTEVAQSASKRGQRKTVAYVLTLQDVPGSHPTNQHRYDDFVSNYTQTCRRYYHETDGDRRYGNDGSATDELVFHRCPGEVTTGIRGSGTTRAWVRCLEQAQRDLAHRSIDSEPFVIFFEDDAKLTDPSFCRRSFRSQVWSDVPEDTFVLMLGGYKFVDTKNQSHGRFSYSTKSYGTYGFALSPSKIPVLRDRWLYDLDNPRYIRGKGKMIPIVSPDITWYYEAEKRNEKVYATNPLLFWHDRTFSNTWNASLTTF